MKAPSVCALLAGVFTAMSCVPSLSAPKSTAGSETDWCEYCKHCPPKGSIAKCQAACMECYIRGNSPTLMAPTMMPAEPDAKRPLPPQKAK